MFFEINNLLKYQITVEVWKNYCNKFLHCLSKDDRLRGFSKLTCKRTFKFKFKTLKIISKNKKYNNHNPLNDF